MGEHGRVEHKVTISVTSASDRGMVASRVGFDSMQREKSLLDLGVMILI